MHATLPSSTDTTTHTTVLFAHPWEGSFNGAILSTVCDALDLQQRAYKVIDLNKDGFSPILTVDELALFSKGEHKDQLVKTYQELLLGTDELIIIFPIWWYGPPAILKGFFDKVMLPTFAYTEKGSILHGQLQHIKRTTVVTTAEVPTWYLKYICGNPVGNTFIKRMLGSVGIKNAKWIHCGYIATGSLAARHRFLEKIKTRFNK